jgi:hypothetical protein
VWILLSIEQKRPELFDEAASLLFEESCYIQLHLLWIRRHLICEVIYDCANQNIVLKAQKLGDSTSDPLAHDIEVYLCDVGQVSTSRRPTREKLRE